MKITTQSTPLKKTRHQGKFPHLQLGNLSLIFTSATFVLFLTIPIIALVIRGITIENWGEIPITVIPPALLLSGFTTLMAIVINFLFGMPLAYVLARRRFPFRSVIDLIIQLPIVLPPAVAGLALLLSFGRNGLFGPFFGQFGINVPFTTLAVILAQVFVSAPFFIRTASVAFASINIEIEDAAKVDGASGWQIFRFVTFPLARRALIAGLILSWARALGEFGATILFAGSISGRTQTMPLLVYNILERDLNAAILTAMILITLAVIALATSMLLMRDSNTLL